MPRRSLLLFTALACATTAGACSEPPSLPGQGVDASRWFDVQLPDVSLPDGFLVTELAGDGAAVAIDPGAACAETGDAANPAPVDASFPPDADDEGDATVDGDVAVPANACAAPLSPGALVFDEVMIASVAGSDDRGQWLEVRSTRTCSVDLLGLHASAPHGQSFRTLDVTSDLWLPAGGFFLIADTLDPTENGALPGLVLAWTGSPADALHKTSDTITLSLGDVMIDTLSYPSKKRTVGTSMAFPSNCAPSLRGDFTTWQPSTASWTPGLFGTPGAPNTDVRCSLARVPTCTASPAPAR